MLEAMKKINGCPVITEPLCMRKKHLKVKGTLENICIIFPSYIEFLFLKKKTPRL